ncbi:hypothetical protein L8S32_05210 [Enterobacter asburiae]|uniref:hypothetical protein n=1 Tax=Enterobacter asburiae TaxID=61645 RepID=UPI0020064869|nr:hypothetical protein [Enterobacter asburiae]MCK6836257.1 hypothetical protein [Enterobacter asburiae]
MKVSNAIVRVAIFSGVCIAGVFVSMAGGMAWGTFDAGMMAFSTIFAAAVAASVPLKF